MHHSKITFSVCMILLASASLLLPSCQKAPQVKPTIAKICTNCHQAEAGSLRGVLDSVAYKNKSIQIKIDETTEIITFDDNLKIKNIQAPADNPDQPLRALRRGKEVLISFTEKNGVKTATFMAAKPVIKVAPEKIMTTAQVEKLVAMGPEKGKYLLIDARPAPRFMEGAIPTAINIPFVAFDKMTDKLPKDKSALVIYYCAGVT